MFCGLQLGLSCIWKPGFQDLCDFLQPGFAICSSHVLQPDFCFVLQPVFVVCFVVFCCVLQPATRGSVPRDDCMAEGTSRELWDTRGEQDPGQADTAGLCPYHQHHEGRQPVTIILL